MKALGLCELGLGWGSVKMVAETGEMQGQVKEHRPLLEAGREAGSGFSLRASRRN